MHDADRPPSRESLRRLLLIGLPLTLVVALVVLVVGARLTGAGGAPAATLAAGSGAAVRTELSGIPQHENVLGQADAPVLVTEYVDLRCGVCASWSARELPLVLAAHVHPGQIRLERRVWPILGPDSERAAEGAAAAAHQGGLFAFSEVWFRNQRGEDEDYADDAFMTAVAAEAGLNPDRFQADLARVRASDEQSTGRIAAASSAAQALGLTGTPAFVVTDASGRARVLNNYTSAHDLGAAIAESARR